MTGQAGPVASPRSHERPVHPAIDPTNPYNETRSFKVLGQPEKRRYRLCFWDGEPTQLWSPTLEVVFGG